VRAGSELKWEDLEHEFQPEKAKTVRLLLCVLAAQNPDISHSPLIVEFIPLLLEHMSPAETFTTVSAACLSSRFTALGALVDASHD
jgi:hypothetical protein